ncbi:MAG: flavin reductase family protein [Bacteroidales bacterium]|nr:flavin reductase family protein [Bacteroidales bacterium]
MKKQIGASTTFFPMPSALVVTGTAKNPNIITIGWICIVSGNPPTIAFSLLNKRHSLQLIRKNPVFTVNIPPADKYKEVDYCGIVSGKDTNKFRDVNFTALKSLNVDVPHIKECPLNMECKVIKEMELGERAIIFGEILETHVDSDKFTKNKIDVKKINPLVYCSTVREYWNLGEKIGLGFSAGNCFPKEKKSK